LHDISANKAKKYLKADDLAFFDAANLAPFGRKSTRIAYQKEQKQHGFGKKQSLHRAGESLGTDK